MGGEIIKRAQSWLVLFRLIGGGSDELAALEFHDDWSLVALGIHDFGYFSNIVTSGELR